MTDLPICGATWNGVGLTYICDQAPGHTGRHYAGHDGERIGWQPDTPATCGSRTRGGFGTTYDCDQPAGHDGAHRAHRDGEYVAGWTDDAAEQPAPDSTGQAEAAPGPLRDDDQRQQHRRTAAFILDRIEPWNVSTRTVAELRRVTTAEQAENDHARAAAADWERLHHLTQDRLSEQIRATQKARQQRSEANERARVAERRAGHAEAERRHADNVIRATLNALGAGPDTDPVIRARETLARAEKAEARAAMLQTSRDYGKERAAELDADRDRYAAKLTAAKAENDGLAECLRNTDRITAAEREEYATEQVQRAVRHLAGSTTNTDLWARIGMTLGWSPEHAGNVARHRRLAGEADLSVKLTDARARLNALIRERDQAVTTLADVHRALGLGLDPTTATG